MARHADPGMNGLEEMILVKVQQRTPPRMNDDTFLNKVLKHQDLSDTGHLQFRAFKQALLPFTAGVSDQNLQAIFDRYALQEGVLNYKAFSTEFVSGVRRSAGMDERDEVYETAEGVLNRVKGFLYSVGPSGIVSLAMAFRNADPQNQRLLGYDVFFDIMSGFFTEETGCPLGEESIDQLFHSFRQNYSPNEIAYDEFFIAVKEVLSPERKDAIRGAFRRLDAHQEGLVDINVVLDSFNASRHPQVADGSRTAEEVTEEFQCTLQDLVAFRRGQRSYPTNLVAWEEFEDYYRFISGCYETDALFSSVLQKVWDTDKVPSAQIESRNARAAPAAGIPPKGRSGLHHWQSNTLPENDHYRHVTKVVNIDEVLARLRASITKKGLRAAVEVVKVLFEADDDVDDAIDAYEFRRACQQLGFSIKDEEEQRIFSLCSGGEAAQMGKMQVSKFLSLLHGAMPAHRVNIVRRAWRKLGGDPDDENSAVSPQQLKDSFYCEGHPDVAHKAQDPALIMNEFLDTFSLLAHIMGGCQDGMVQISDFMAYYEVVSSTIDKDAFFDLLLHRLWGLEPVSGQDAKFAPPPRRVPAYDAAPSPLAGVKPPRHEGPSAYSTTNVADPSQHEVHRRFMRQDAPSVADQYGVGVSPITKSGIVFNEGHASEVGSISRKTGVALARRGLKGWMGLVTRFQQSDHRKTGSTLRCDFERIHKAMGLGLSPEELQNLFKGLSATRKDQAVDYRQYLQLVKGNLSQRRMQLVYTMLGNFQDSSGGVPAEMLKRAFQPHNAPHSVLGKRSDADIANELYEAVDFFAGGPVFSPEAFVDFFTIISSIYSEDDEFRLMCSTAFGCDASPR